MSPDHEEVVSLTMGNDESSACLMLTETWRMVTLALDPHGSPRMRHQAPASFNKLDAASPRDQTARDASDAASPLDAAGPCGVSPLVNGTLRSNGPRGASPRKHRLPGPDSAAGAGWKGDWLEHKSPGWSMVGGAADPCGRLGEDVEREGRGWTAYCEQDKRTPGLGGAIGALWQSGADLAEEEGEEDFADLIWPAMEMSAALVSTGAYTPRAITPLSCIRPSADPLLSQPLKIPSLWGRSHLWSRGGRRQSRRFVTCTLTRPAQLQPTASSPSYHRLRMSIQSSRRIQRQGRHEEGVRDLTCER